MSAHDLARNFFRKSWEKFELSVYLCRRAASEGNVPDFLLDLFCLIQENPANVEVTDLYR